MAAPLSAITAGPTGSELATVSVATDAPLVGGVNVTVSVHPWFGASDVTGQGTATRNAAAPIPEIALAMFVTVALPVLSRVSVRLDGAPTSTDPKASAPGDTCRCACTPTPVSAAVNGSGVALVARLNVPVRVPVAAGVKVTFSVQLDPPASDEPHNRPSRRRS
jgi:hypothetical protein